MQNLPIGSSDNIGKSFKEKLYNNPGKVGATVGFSIFSILGVSALGLSLTNKISMQFAIAGAVAALLSGLAFGLIAGLHLDNKKQYKKLEENHKELEKDHKNLEKKLKEENTFYDAEKEQDTLKIENKQNKEDDKNLLEGTSITESAEQPAKTEQQITPPTQQDEIKTDQVQNETLQKSI